MNFFAYLFAGLGEPLIGAVMDATNTASVFGLAALFCWMSAVIVLFVRR